MCWELRKPFDSTAAPVEPAVAAAGSGAVVERAIGGRAVTCRPAALAFPHCGSRSAGPVRPGRGASDARALPGGTRRPRPAP